MKAKNRTEIDKKEKQNGNSNGLECGELCSRNGLPAVSVHGLRHMFVTILIE